MPYEAYEFFTKFGYTLTRYRLHLPVTTLQLDRLPELRQGLEGTLLLISLSAAKPNSH
jgi:hypothetical protein